METYLECIPCFLRQALDATRLAGADRETQKRTLDDIARILPSVPLNFTPPEIARAVYDIVGKHTAGEDAYRKVKEKSNDLAMSLYPRLKRMVKKADNTLLSAVRLAVAGNVIDYGVSRSFDIEEEIRECLEKSFAIFDFKEFSSAVQNAKSVLYLLDNAGEIVFDRILIEVINKEVVCAVRGEPIINDVTMDDARQIGLDRVATVISSGSKIPGTIVADCEGKFPEYYDKADIVISKGQGNFETLGEEDKTIFFIFKAKCPVVAAHVGCKEGDIILKKHKPARQVR